MMVSFMTFSLTKIWGLLLNLNKGQRCQFWQSEDGKVQMRYAILLLLYLATLIKKSWWDFAAGKENEFRSSI